MNDIINAPQGEFDFENTGFTARDPPQNLIEQSIQPSTIDDMLTIEQKKSE
jgi:hypothetical protein